MRPTVASSSMSKGGCCRSAAKRASATPGAGSPGAGWSAAPRGTWAPPGPSTSPALECSTPFRHVACTRASGRCITEVNEPSVSLVRGVACSARDRPRSGGEVVGRPPPGIELGAVGARPTVLSLGAVRRCPVLGLEETAGLDERLLPESGGGAVGRMFFGIKVGKTGDAEPLLRMRETDLSFSVFDLSAEWCKKLRAEPINSVTTFYFGGVKLTDWTFLPLCTTQHSAARAGCRDGGERR